MWNTLRYLLANKDILCRTFCTITLILRNMETALKQLVRHKDQGEKKKKKVAAARSFVYFFIFFLLKHSVLKDCLSKSMWVEWTTVTVNTSCPHRNLWKTQDIFAIATQWGTSQKSFVLTSTLRFSFTWKTHVDFTVFVVVVFIKV